jgi:plastocyanin
MSRSRILTLMAVAAFVVVACGGGTATIAPTAAAPSAAAPSAAAPSAAAPSEAPSGEASPSAAEGGAPCSASDAAGTVSVGIANFAFDPAAVTAKVGDIITWTNNDTTGHTATIKGNESCTTPILSPGSSGGITFSQPGTYDYFCKIHPTITGTIAVTS